MTEDEARAAVTRAVDTKTNADTAAERAREELHDAIRSAANVLRQVDLVRLTGYTREHIRQITRAGQSA